MPAPGTETSPKPTSRERYQWRPRVSSEGTHDRGEREPERNKPVSRPWPPAHRSREGEVTKARVAEPAPEVVGHRAAHPAHLPDVPSSGKG